MNDPGVICILILILFALVFRTHKKVWKCPVCSFECSEEHKRDADTHTIEHAGHKPALKEKK